MSNARKGFSRERHGVLKALVSLVAVGGFVTTWVGFSASQGNASAAPVATGVTAPATATPTPRVNSSLPGGRQPAVPSPTPTTATGGASPAATPSVRKPTPAPNTTRRSRGS